jgi:hypothetical protein
MATMGLLFLDPLVLAAIGATLIGCWVVWRGTLRAWFGRPEAWTVFIWPLPVVLVLTPFVVGPLRAALALVFGLLGQQLTDTADAFVFAALYLVPIVGLSLWPPRWLLPGWARARLVRPARPAQAATRSVTAPADAAGEPGSDRSDTGDGSAPVLLPACLGRRGHGSRARWVWQVDAVAGTLVIADGRVRFRPDPPAGTSLQTGELSASSGPARRTETASAAEPGTRGGDDGVPGEVSWGRRFLDADLAALDAVRVHARRPWADDGVLTLESAGRPPAHVWVNGVDRLQAALGSTRV